MTALRESRRVSERASESGGGDARCDVAAAILEARRVMFPYIEGRYNPGWRHSALGYKARNEFEATAALAAQSRSP